MSRLWPLLSCLFFVACGDPTSNSSPDDAAGGDAAIEAPDGGDAAIPKADGGDAAIPIPDGGDAAIEAPDGGDAAISIDDGGDAAIPPDGGDAAISARDGGDAAISARDGGDAAIDTPDLGIDAGLDSGVASACGDGIADMNEECDDGNSSSGDGCDASCLLEGTIPLIINMGIGESSYYLTCSICSWFLPTHVCPSLTTCTVLVPALPDVIVEIYSYDEGITYDLEWSCDHPFCACSELPSGDAECSATPTSTTTLNIHWQSNPCAHEELPLTCNCGNNIIEGVETCDPPQPGCNSSCSVELGWTCSGSPSVCTMGP